MGDDITAPANLEPAPSTPVAPLRASLNGELTLLAICGVVIALSMILSPSDSAVSLFGWTLPPLCLFKVFSSYDCLGCGLTRSFVYMGHFEFSAAFERHMLGPLLYLLVASQVPWRTYRGIQLHRKARMHLS